MTLEQRLDALSAWGAALAHDNTLKSEKFQRAEAENGWFTQPNLERSLDAILTHYLDRDKLTQWTERYRDQLTKSGGKTIGLVLAGNIPLVGFHDVLAVLVSGHKAQVKLSHKDQVLLPYMLEVLSDIAPDLAERVQTVERLEGFDAVIATGSNNSARYFEYYFGKYPNIIRKNRNSVAVLTGDESETELKALADDVFAYFGLGCRNVSQLLVPQGYDFSPMLDAWSDYKWLMDHHKYGNNFDYHRSLLLINGSPHLMADFVMLLENDQIASPLAMLHYRTYETPEQVNQYLHEKQNEIQVVVSHSDQWIESLNPGTAQQPELWDYADRVDTMEFLTNIK